MSPSLATTGVAVALGLAPTAAGADAGSGAAAAGSPGREVRLLMGTTAEVRAGGLADPGPALEAAFSAMGVVDERLSLWHESELGALDRAGAGVVSRETLAVIGHALDVAAASDGAFDPTVEPLVRAAGGFGDPPRALGPAERRALLSRVGFRHVRVDVPRRRVELLRGARLVLDGLAKGFAADRATAALRRAGARRGLVDLGESSLSVFGEPLTVDLRDPTGGGRAWGSFRVEDAAVSSSGGDQRPGHILDPRTGRPARTGVLQASVVADRGIEADALSTAVFVLGAERGLELLARRGAAGLCLLVEGDRRVIRTTPGFRRSYSLAAAPGVEVRE